jgi:hypothetical protein
MMHSAGCMSHAPYFSKRAVQPRSRVVDFLVAYDVRQYDEAVALEALDLVLSYGTLLARRGLWPV